MKTLRLWGRWSGPDIPDLQVYRQAILEGAQRSYEGTSGLRILKITTEAARVRGVEDHDEYIALAPDALLKLYKWAGKRVAELVTRGLLKKG